jgi:hypothetical protein
VTLLGDLGDLFLRRDKRPTLDDLARPYKLAGRDIRVRIDDADLDLIAEALERGCSKRSWEDSQCCGRFHHYTLKIDRVEFELITTKPVEAFEAKRARYLGMTITDYRKLFSMKGS